MSLRQCSRRGFLILVVLVAACGRSAVRPAPPAPTARLSISPDACALSADTAVLPSTLSVGVSGSVDPAHAPLPTTDAERFVFRQVYETLIRLDCADAPAPGLAQSWSSDDGGRRWTFTLRRGASFADGVPMTTADVFAALTRDSLLVDRAAITLDGIDRLSVRLPRAFATVPLIFADPALAVTRRGASGDWLVGTGPATADTAGGHVVVTPLTAGPPVLTVRSSTGGDARDLLDRGIELLVTGDPEVLSYAAGRSDLGTLPLPWDRTYVLVAAVPIAVSDSLRANLARDVVRIDARAATAPFWWSGASACPAAAPASPPPVATAPGPSLLYYPRDDGPARDLAERLVALGLAGAGARAAGVAPSDLGALLASGGSAIYLVPLPKTALEPCRAVREMVGRAPWLSDDPARHIVALVETRRRVIVRRGAAAFSVDWDGTLRLR